MLAFTTIPLSGQEEPTEISTFHSPKPQILGKFRWSNLRFILWLYGKFKRHFLALKL